MTGTGPWADNWNCFCITEVPKSVYYVELICDANFPGSQLKRKVKKPQPTTPLNWFIEVRTTESTETSRKYPCFCSSKQAIAADTRRSMRMEGKQPPRQSPTQSDDSVREQHPQSCTTALPRHKLFCVNLSSAKSTSCTPGQVTNHPGARTNICIWNSTCDYDSGCVTGKKMCKKDNLNSTFSTFWRANTSVSKFRAQKRVPTKAEGGKLCLAKKSLLKLLHFCMCVPVKTSKMMEKWKVLCWSIFLDFKILLWSKHL